MAAALPEAGQVQLRGLHQPGPPGTGNSRSLRIEKFDTSV